MRRRGPSRCLGALGSLYCSFLFPGHYEPIFFLLLGVLAVLKDNAWLGFGGLYGFSETELGSSNARQVPHLP